MKSDLNDETSQLRISSNKWELFSEAVPMLLNSMKKNGLEISLQPAHRGFSGFLSIAFVPAPGRHEVSGQKFWVTNGGLGVV